jgi:hypothetical protein
MANLSGQAFAKWCRTAHPQARSPANGLPRPGSRWWLFRDATGEHAEQFAGQVRGSDDAAFGVVVEAVCLAGFRLPLGLNGFLARGGYLEELFLVGGGAAHG